MSLNEGIGKEIDALLPSHSLLYQIAQKVPAKITEVDPTEPNAISETFIEVLRPNHAPPFSWYLELQEDLQTSGIVDIAGHIAQELAPGIARALDQQFVDSLLTGDLKGTIVEPEATNHPELFRAHGHVRCIIAPTAVADGARWTRAIHGHWPLDDKGLTISISVEGHPTFDHDKVVVTVPHFRGRTAWYGMKVQVPNFRFWVDPKTVKIVPIVGDDIDWLL